MANELYIHTLRQLRDGCLAENMDTEAEALEAAIQALSCDGDCISRTAAINVAIDAINEWGGGWDAEREVRDAINALPSAQIDGDCISRQAAIKEAESWVGLNGYEQHLQRNVVEWLKELPSAQPEPQWIPCSECIYWRDERVLMNDGKARQYNGDEPDALGIKHSVTTDVGINEGAKCLYEEGRGWRTDHTTFRNADDFCSRAKKRPCSYEEWYGIVDGVYAEPWRGEET